MMRGGHELTHDTFRSVTVVVETPRPYTTPFLCPTCHTTHTLKSVHLLLDDRGKVTVSQGVYDDLLAAGLPGFTRTGWVPDPPVLMVGAGRSREQIDYENRTIREYR